MRQDHLEHEFVESVPEPLEHGVLYISIDYDTMVHLCACGCGHQVVLPLHPTGWRLNYDGESVSISPSVGNWSFACRSHYWIDHNRIRWAGAWTDEEVTANRRRTLIERGAAPTPDSPSEAKTRLGLWSRIWQRVRRAMKRGR